MWLYRVFQNGLVFVSLVAGIAVAGHMVYCHTTKCRNWLTIFATIITGFFHMMTCLFLLGLSDLSGYSEFLHSGQHDCVDYTPAANTANVIVITIVALNIIKQNFTSPKTYCAMIVQLVLSLSGFIILTRSRNITESSRDMYQEVAITLGRTDSPHIDVLWSVCQKRISSERYNLVCEYGLLYLPLTVIALIAWYKSYRRTGDIALIRLKVLDANCRSDDLCVPPCICTKLNSAFVALLFYFFIVIFIARPAMILYGHMTSGLYRDILPSLLQTVLYCFVCSEYIMWCYRLEKVGHRHKSLNSSTVICV